MRIAVAMSGGLDSTVVAALLRAEGHDVIGVSMAVWRNSLCCSFEDVSRAKEVCRMLGIKHYLIDLLEAFKAQIVRPYVSERLQGITPNPCPTCNSDFKLGLMWDKLLERTHADMLATGHYCQILMDFDRRYRLVRATDLSRDQAYMLWTLSQDQLARTLFPLGHYLKSEVRVLAQDLGVKILTPGRESQDLCFIVPDKHTFWQEQALEQIQAGPLRTTDGELIGRHRGLPFYTPGQRRGLEHNRPERLYVTALDPETNTVIVGALDELNTLSVEIAGLNIFLPEHCGDFEALVQLRLHGDLLPAKIELYAQNTQARLMFAEPVMAPAQGQTVVAYNQKDQVCLGGVVR